MTLILMIIIIKIFSGIFLCTLLGTILYLFWKAVGRLIEHKGYIDINYLIWKMVLLMFAIPITLIYANGFEKSTYVFEVTGPIKWVIGILMIIWLVGTIIFTIRFLEKYRAIRKDILNADPCGDEIQSMVKSISKKLGVHKEIQVVILEKAGGPMLYGVLKPRIILSRIYDPQQLNMIFTHELIHYKHHDLIWKHLANIICCIYWFQPALKDVFYQLDQWGETYCDRTVCEYLPDVKGYFSTIIDISMEEIRYGRYTTAGLYESKEVLKLRMERMKSYRQQRRLRRGISVSVLFGMIILSATTVFASGIGFVKAYDKIADETREEINVGTEGDIKDQKAKYRMYDKTRIKKCMIKNERLKENDGKPFTWKIKPKERIETKEGYLNKGTYVDIAACMGFEEEHPDMVVNFAAESHVDRSIENPEVFLDTNIKGTAVLMDACRKYGIRRYHQVSTDEVYGDLPLDRPDLFFTEETPIHTSSPYSSSKAGADLLVLAYHRTYGLPVTISRCSNNYGPYHFPEKLIPLMIANALNDKPLPVYGKGENVRDWLYVEDHCRAIDLIIHNGRVGEVYNVGGHNEMKNIDIVKIICKELGKPESLITYVADRKGHDMRYAIDPTKIHNELGWLPETKFADGIKKTIQWYLDNKEWWETIISGEYQDYYEKMYKNR